MDVLAEFVHIRVLLGLCKCNQNQFYAQGRSLWWIEVYLFKKSFSLCVKELCLFMCNFKQLLFCCNGSSAWAKHPRGVGSWICMNFSINSCALTQLGWIQIRLYIKSHCFAFQNFPVVFLPETYLPGVRGHRLLTDTRTAVDQSCLFPTRPLLPAPSLYRYTAVEHPHAYLGNCQMIVRDRLWRAAVFPTDKNAAICLFRLCDRCSVLNGTDP